VVEEARSPEDAKYLWLGLSGIDRHNSKYPDWNSARKKSMCWAIEQAKKIFEDAVSGRKKNNAEPENAEVPYAEEGSPSVHRVRLNIRRRHGRGGARYGCL